MDDKTMLELATGGLKPKFGVLIAYELGKQHGERGIEPWRGGDPVLRRAYNIGYESGQRAAEIGKGMGVGE